jgi:hypothetical protein
LIPVQLIGGPAHGHQLDLDADLMDPPAEIELPAFVMSAVFNVAADDSSESTRYVRQPNPLDSGPLWLYVSEARHAPDL